MSVAPNGTPIGSPSPRMAELQWHPYSTEWSRTSEDCWSTSQDYLKHCSSSLGQEKVGSSFLGVVNPFSKGKAYRFKDITWGVTAQPGLPFVLPMKRNKNLIRLTQCQNGCYWWRGERTYNFQFSHSTYTNQSNTLSRHRQILLVEEVFMDCV